MRRRTGEMLMNRGMQMIRKADNLVRSLSSADNKDI